MKKQELSELRFKLLYIVSIIWKFKKGYHGTLFIAVKNTVRRKGDYYATARREQLQAVSSFGCKTIVGVWFSAA